MGENFICGSSLAMCCLNFFCVKNFSSFGVNAQCVDANEHCLKMFSLHFMFLWQSFCSLCERWSAVKKRANGMELRWWLWWSNSRLTYALASSNAEPISMALQFKLLSPVDFSSGWSKTQSQACKVVHCYDVPPGRDSAYTMSFWMKRKCRSNNHFKFTAHHIAKASHTRYNLTNTWKINDMIAHQSHVDFECNPFAEFRAIFIETRSQSQFVDGVHGVVCEPAIVIQ